jgi:hypothetical protein
MICDLRFTIAEACRRLRCGVHLDGSTLALQPPCHQQCQLQVNFRSKSKSTTK